MKPSCSCGACRFTFHLAKAFVGFTIALAVMSWRVDSIEFKAERDAFAGRFDQEHHAAQKQAYQRCHDIIMRLEKRGDPCHFCDAEGRIW